MKTLTSLKLAIMQSIIALCLLLCATESAAQMTATRQIQGATHVLDTTQRARLTVHLTGGGTAARWFYQNPDTGVYAYYASDDTATIKADYLYNIGFLNVGGWANPQSMQAYADANEHKTYFAAYEAVPSGYVKVNLTGDNGLAQWRLNIGNNSNPVWYNSGDSVRMNIGWAYIIFKDIPNYIIPQNIYTNIYTDSTSVLAAAYQEIVYNTVQVNIVGGNGAGAWTRDSDTTRHYSGDTLHLATNNNCTLYLSPVQGWESQYQPDIIGQNLTAGIVNVDTLVYTKIKKAVVRINVSGGGGNGQWSSDSGLTWRNSNDTMQTIANNTFITFKNVARWTHPNDLYINAQTLDTTITNTFTVEYQPIPYRTVQVTLAGANGSGQWTIDNNNVPNANLVWRNSGDTAVVDSRFGYQIIYKNVNAWVTPPNEYIYLGNSPNITPYNIESTYTTIQYGVARITLTGANGQGHWRVRSNSTGTYYTAWRNTNDTVYLRSDRANDYIIEFRTITNWNAPILTPIGVGANHTTTFTFHYTLDTVITNPNIARLTVHLTGDNGLGFWNINGINYRSDDTITVNVGTCYAIYYSNVAGVITPNYNIVCAVAGINSLTANYSVVQRNYLTVNLTGANNQGAWSIDWGNTWQQSGDTITTQAGQFVYITFKDVHNWRKPEQVQTYLQSGGYTITASYTHLQYARVIVHINGANGQGRWNIYNGAQQLMPNDTILIPYYVNDFQINFTNVADWYTPNAIYITPDVNALNEYTVTYTPIIYTPITVHITGAAGQGRWTIDGQTLHRSDDTVQIESNTYQYIQYVDVPDWITPSTMQSYFDATTTTVQGIYRQQIFGYIRVLLTGANGQGQWSLDGGTTWQQGGDSIRVSANNTYTIYIKNINGWHSLTNGIVHISANQHYTTSFTYTATVYKTLKVTLLGGNGQGKWRVYNTNNAQYSAWRNNQDTLHLEQFVAYNIVFDAVSHFSLPANNGANVQLTTDSIHYFTATYTPVTYAVLKVVLTGDNGLGQWRANSGALHHSNDTVMIAANRSVYIEYTTLNAYITPSAFYIQSISANATNIVFGTYIAIPPPYITFKGAIVGGNSTAKWSIDGGNTWHNHNDTLRLATSQSYTVRYKPVSGWVTPAEYTFTPVQNIVYTGTYTLPQFGILKVTILGGDSKGRWRIGNSAWHLSGDTLHLLTGTTYAVVFKNVNKWITPGQYDYTPSANQTLNIPAQYVEEPFTIVEVNLTGGNDEGLWTLGNGYFYNSGDTVHLSALRIYNLYCSDVIGWVTPAAIYSFEPNGNATQSITRAYTRPNSIKKTLRVNLIGGGGLAQWTIDNGTTWKNSGDTLQLQPQTYSVNYKNVSGWITPLFSSFRGIDGDSTITATYRAIQYNTLQVNLVGGDGLAQWTINNGTTWHNSGDTLHLPSHINYYINYKTVSGWISPSFNAYPATTVPSTVITATYQAIGYGILQVNMTGGGGLAQWSINGTRWLNSGDTLRLPNTQAVYFVSYKTVTGWIKPQGASYTVPANQTTVVNAAYLAIGYGILQVNITGGDGLGQWSINNGVTWRNSGDTITLINSTLYTIKYKAVANWLAPTNVVFRSVVNQTTIINGIYAPAVTPPPTALKVVIWGGNSQGLWSIDEITWHTSGDSITFANANNWNTVYFSPVAGWTKPNQQPVSLINAQTVTLRGDYVLQVSTASDILESSLTIFPNPADAVLHCNIKNASVNQVLRLRLYNAVGVLVYENSVFENDTHDINLLPYPAGFYVLSLYNEKTGSSVQQKVVVRH